MAPAVDPAELRDRFDDIDLAFGVVAAAVSVPRPTPGTSTA
jgi:hypothetical protein